MKTATRVPATTPTRRTLASTPQTWQTDTTSVGEWWVRWFAALRSDIGTRRTLANATERIQSTQPSSHCGLSYPQSRLIGSCPRSRRCDWRPATSHTCTPCWWWAWTVVTSRAWSTKHCCGEAWRAELSIRRRPSVHSVWAPPNWRARTWVVPIPRQ